MQQICSLNKNTLPTNFVPVLDSGIRLIFLSHCLPNRSRVTTAVLTGVPMTIEGATATTSQSPRSPQCGEVGGSRVTDPESLTDPGRENEERESGVEVGTGPESENPAPSRGSRQRDSSTTINDGTTGTGLRKTMTGDKLSDKVPKRVARAKTAPQSIKRSPTLNCPVRSQKIPTRSGGK